MLQQQTKKLTSFEKMFLDLDERCQLAVEISKPELIPKIIRNLKNNILGFQLKLEGSKVVSHNNPISIHSLPQNITNPREACDYIYSIGFDIKNTFAAIAANDKTVALSAHHMICDGGLLVEAFDKLLIDDQCQLKSKVPLTVCDMFSTQLSNLKKNEIEEAKHSLDNITTIRWSKNYQELQKKPGIKSICTHISDESPTKDFQFHKAKMNLTDIYMTSFLLSILSLNGRIDSNFGINIPVNLRQFIPKNEKNFSNTQNSSFVIANAFNVSPKTTIRELSKMLRRDLTSKLNSSMPLAIYKCYLDNCLDFNHKFCCYPEMSNIGQFKSEFFNYSEIVNDMWVQSSSTHPSEECIFIVAFSKMKNGENYLCERIRTPPSVFSEIDSKMLMMSFLRMMKEVPVDVSIQDAYDDIRKFQNKIKKEY